jgi:mannose-6-phosphate isomerase-like protein (cupin superfamily)
MRIISGAGVYQRPADGTPNDFTEQLRVAALSVGTYSIPAGGTDDQSPHRQDEIYVVTAGRAVLEADTGRVPVGPGDVVYVPAGEGHRFVDVTGDLALLVLFAPPYTEPE